VEAEVEQNMAAGSASWLLQVRLTAAERIAVCGCFSGCSGSTSEGCPILLRHFG